MMMKVNEVIPMLTGSKETSTCRITELIINRRRSKEALTESPAKITESSGIISTESFNKIINRIHCHQQMHQLKLATSLTRTSQDGKETAE